MKPTTSEYIIVKKSKVHGTGVFAKKNIPEDTRILEYVGDKITKKEADRRAEYNLENFKKDKSKLPGFFIFELNKRHDIDGDVKYNTAKYINHSCDPNSFCKNYCDIAKRDIKKGEEITEDYSKENNPDFRMKCNCGSKNCKKEY